jgi:hypothetical protein
MKSFEGSTRNEMPGCLVRVGGRGWAHWLIELASLSRSR